MRLRDIGSLPDSEKGLNFEKNEIFVKNILFNRKNDVNNTFNFLCFQKEKKTMMNFFLLIFFSLFNQTNDISYNLLYFYYNVWFICLLFSSIEWFEFFLFSVTFVEVLFNLTSDLEIIGTI